MSPVTPANDYANHIAERIQTAERSIDDAIADLSLLTHDLTRHRADHRLAARVGQQALLDATAATQTLTQARAQVVSCHTNLSRTARAMGWHVTAGGPWEGKDGPPPPPTGRLVQEA
jgi:hypothetical protein